MSDATYLGPHRPGHYPERGTSGGHAGERLHRVVADAVDLIPTGRPAETDEVAAAVAFLVREDAGFVTGQVVSVNGGSSMQ